jgi:hypothetical protein
MVEVIRVGCGPSEIVRHQGIGGYVVSRKSSVCVGKPAGGFHAEIVGLIVGIDRFKEFADIS